MSVSHFLYQLLIGPLELLFEVLYAAAGHILHNSGLSITVLSLAVNILVLPLYNRAETVQREERELEKRMEPGVRHIRRTFRGDERFMMLQTYYRQNGYSPVHALKGSLPLLLQVPFFIAAYRFLSGLEELRGMPFGPIADLGAPDGLLRLPGLTLHALPLAMTLINLVSCVIYARGHSRKEKIQLYGMALLFLALLYRSPAGLVFYWTLNNLFSLGKNMVQKSRHGRAALSVLMAAAALALLGYALFLFPGESRRQRAVLIAAALLLFLPLLRRMLPALGVRAAAWSPASAPRLFFGCCLFLTLLCGALIPSAVIAASPSEFVIMTDYRSPLLHVLDALLLAAGCFLIWFGIFYYLADEKRRALFGLGMWLAAGIAVMNYMFFGTGLGRLSPELRYVVSPEFTAAEKLGNLAASAVLAALLLLLHRRRRSLAGALCLALLLAAGGMTLANVGRIGAELPRIREIVRNTPGETPTLRLSRTEKNVAVLMMDRAIGCDLPFLMAEKPELERQFDGFVFYPNTISFGPTTNFGVPAVYGGYEYTPEEMNRRDGERLVDKHNEALRVMPALFDGAGWQVTVFDPSYAGYTLIPDLSVYDDYPNVRRFVTEHGQFSVLPGMDLGTQMQRIWTRNFFCYGLMKCAPPVVQLSLYQNGSYFDPSSATMRAQVEYGVSVATGFKKDFLNAYSVLCALPEITELTADGVGCFFLMSNVTSHEPVILQAPEYEPVSYVDNRDYDRTHTERFTQGGLRLSVEKPEQMGQYHCTMAALCRLGQWLDHLRENGVYDNTRIIIVADHGFNLYQLEQLAFGPGPGENPVAFNPLLMVKDFGAAGFRTDTSFMTNADTPTLAMDGLIESPVNPFTGKPINSEAKNAPEQHIFDSDAFNVGENNGNTFLPGTWYAVRENIFDASNWRRIEAP